jgi:hypothetical protein
MEFSFGSTPVISTYAESPRRRRRRGQHTVVMGESSSIIAAVGAVTGLIGRYRPTNRKQPSSLPTMVGVAESAMWLVLCVPVRRRRVVWRDTEKLGCCGHSQ